MRKYVIVCLAILLCFHSGLATTALVTAEYGIEPICNLQVGPTTINVEQSPVPGAVANTAFTRYYDTGTKDNIEIRGNIAGTTLTLTGLDHKLDVIGPKIATVSSGATIERLFNSIAVIKDSIGSYRFYWFAQSGNTLTSTELHLPPAMTAITTFKPLSLTWTSATTAYLDVLAAYTDSGSPTVEIYKFSIDTAALGTTITGTTVGINRPGHIDAGSGFPIDLVGGTHMLVKSSDGTCYESNASSYVLTPSCNIVIPGINAGSITDYVINPYNLVSEVIVIYSVKNDHKVNARLRIKKGVDGNTQIVITDAITLTHKHASDLVRNVIVWGEKTVAWITVDWAAGAAIVSNTYTVATSPMDDDIKGATHAALAGNRVFLITSAYLLILENRKSDKIQPMRKIILEAGSVATALSITTGTAQFKMKLACGSSVLLLNRFTCFSTTLNCVGTTAFDFTVAPKVQTSPTIY